MGSITYLSRCLWASVRPYAFYANVRSKVESLVHIAITGGNRSGFDFEKGRKNLVRCWEYRLGAAYGPEFV